MVICCQNIWCLRMLHVSAVDVGLAVCNLSVSELSVMMFFSAGTDDVAKSCITGVEVWGWDQA